MNSRCLLLLISPLPVFTKHANCAKGILVKAIGDMGECLYIMIFIDHSAHESVVR